MATPVWSDIPPRAHRVSAEVAYARNFRHSERFII